MAGSELHHDMWRLMEGTHDYCGRLKPPSASHASQFNQFFFSLDSANGDELTRTFIQEMKSQGFSRSRGPRRMVQKEDFLWFRKLCDLIFGEEVSSSGAPHWKILDYENSWLDGSNSPEKEGQDLARELMVLLNPHGKFMEILHMLSDPKRVAEHWTMCVRSPHSEIPEHENNYVTFPFNVFPVATQREWALNWRSAINAGGVPTSNSSSSSSSRPLRAGGLAFYQHLVWCPVTYDRPFKVATEKNFITGVQLTPFAYLTLRFTVFLWVRCNAISLSDFFPRPDWVDAIQRQATRLYTAVTSPFGPGDMSSYQRGWPTREYRQRTMAEILPGYATVIDLFQCAYLPAPGQPFLRRYVPATYQRLWDHRIAEPWDDDLSRRDRPIPTFCSSVLAASINEMWIRATVDMWSLIEQPSPDPFATSCRPEGVPQTIEINTEMAPENVRVQIILACQPLTAITRALQFHDYLATCGFPGGSAANMSRLSGLQRFIVPSSVTRSFQGAVLQYVHLILSMATGASGALTRFAHREHLPLLEVLALWAAAISPYRPSSVLLPGNAHDGTVLVRTPLAGDPKRAPCLWWGMVGEGSVAVESLLAPEDFRLWHPAVRMVGCLNKGGVLPLRHPMLPYLSPLDALTVLSYSQPLSGQIAERAGGRETYPFEGDTLPSVSATLPVPEMHYAIAPLSPAEFYFDVEGLLEGPFLADWEHDVLLHIGRKPTTLDRSPFQSLRHHPLVNHTSRAWAHLCRTTRRLISRTAVPLWVPNPPGPPFLSFPSTYLWRETRSVLAAALSAPAQSSNVMRIRSDHPHLRFVSEMSEGFVVLFADLLDVLNEGSFVRNSDQCTDEVLLAVHKLLCVITDPLVPTALGMKDQQQQQQHAVPAPTFLPPDTVPIALRGFRCLEDKIARLCLDLKYRLSQVGGNEKALGGNGVSEAIVKDMLQRLQGMSHGVSARLAAMERTQTWAPAASAPGGNVRAETGLDEPRLNATDYERYELNSKGREKVLSCGAPFEFRDRRLQGSEWVERVGPDSVWRYLRWKMPLEQRRKYFPYNRPPTSSERKWALQATRILDRWLVGALDYLHCKGCISNRLNIAWFDADSGDPLPTDVSAAIESAHARHIKVDIVPISNSDGVVDVDFTHMSARIPGSSGSKGVFLMRAVIEPPSFRVLASDTFILIGFFCIIAMYLWHPFLFYALIATVCALFFAGSVLYRPIAKPIFL